MKDAIKGIGAFVSSKLGLSVLGLLGGSVGLVLLLAFVFLAFFIGVLGGSSASEQAEQEQEYENQGGNYTCSTTGEINKEVWDSQWKKMGVVKEYGDTVIEISEERGLDPVLFASIMAFETGWGTSSALVGYKNPGGLMNPASSNSTGFFKFDTYEDGIRSMSNTLYNRIIVDGLVTIDKLGPIYAPVGAKNDPNNTNSNWIPSVTSIAQQFGGLTMNCEPSNDFVIDFEGDVSELRKNLAIVGNKWIGRTQYVFGGGRTTSSIARGDFDCSSFVHWAYKQNGIDLGHVSGTSTETLNKIGTKISINDIKVGDLIFWDSYKKDGHVGIYIGDGKFIGSQTSTGVAIESLNHSYWSPRFSGHVRRIIND